MVVSKTISSTVLLENNYQMIYPDTIDNHIREPRWVEGWIYLHELLTGDQVQILFSNYDPVGQVLRGYDAPIISGLQEPIPTFHFGAVLTPWHQIQIRQTLAPSTYKNVNYIFYEVL